VLLAYPNPSVYQELASYVVFFLPLGYLAYIRLPEVIIDPYCSFELASMFPDELDQQFAYVFSHVFRNIAFVLMVLGLLLFRMTCALANNRQ
jgi:hypothetical protein